MKRMNVYVYACFSLLAFSLAACSESEAPANEETGKVKFEISFQGTAPSRAQTSAVPPTSWANISKVQFFLYDSAGEVKYSCTENPTSTATSFAYSDVPAAPGGTTYTLVAVANAKSSTDAIVSYTDGGTTPMEWLDYNVRAKSVNTQLLLKPKTGTFPSFLGTAFTTPNAAYTTPSEIFMGSVSVTVIPNTTVTAPTIALKREVSMMRVRLCLNAAENGAVNTDGPNGVDWTQDASVLIYRVPAGMKITAGTSGGTLNTSIANSIMIGATSFNASNPSAADNYTNPATMLDTDFTLWKDIIVFPNNGGRVNDTDLTGDTSPTQQYYVVVTARGKAGHILADGQTLAADATLFWGGLVTSNFCPNTIREVNLTLKSGGRPIIDIPVVPIEQGELIINVGTPTPWDNNIQESSIIV